MRKLLIVLLLFVACGKDSDPTGSDQNGDPPDTPPVTYRVEVHSHMNTGYGSRFTWNWTQYVTGGRSTTIIGNFEEGTYSWRAEGAERIQGNEFRFWTLGSGEIYLDRNRVCDLYNSGAYW
jgi:hypothetical protein